jgi:hypothetical protein
MADHRHHQRARVPPVTCPGRGDARGDTNRGCWRSLPRESQSVLAGSAVRRPPSRVSAIACRLPARRAGSRMVHKSGRRPSGTVSVAPLDDLTGPEPTRAPAPVQRICIRSVITCHQRTPGPRRFTVHRPPQAPPFRVSVDRSGEAPARPPTPRADSGNLGTRLMAPGVRDPSVDAHVAIAQTGISSTHGGRAVADMTTEGEAI